MEIINWLKQKLPFNLEALTRPRYRMYLTAADGVKWTEATTPVYEKLQLAFEAAQLGAIVSRAYASPEDQLGVIQRYLVRKGLAARFTDAFDCKVEDKMEWEDREIYKWQLGWSGLLVAHIDINPCFDADLLLSRVIDGVETKGRIYKQTTHASGLAFDIGGGADHNPDNEATVIINAWKTDPFLKERITQVLVEHGNICVHIGCKLVEVQNA